mmetsp:Transcript_78901/g.152357  ORF Transcript_78901/g.152357 Transcript_78901/m.152357 type:complete len:304 (-) Transcript_78901:30-941(-)
MQEDAVGADNGFKKNCRNRVWTFTQDLFLEHAKALKRSHLVTCTCGKSQCVRVEDLNKTRLFTPETCAEVASGRQGSSCATMVRAHGAHDLALAGVTSCNANCSLICLAAAQWKQEAVDVTRRDFSKQVAKASPDLSHGHARVCIKEVFHLFDDCLLDPFIQCVTHVGAHCLACEVHVFLTRAVVEVHAFTTHYSGQIVSIGTVGPSHDNIVAHRRSYFFICPFIPKMLVTHLAHGVVHQGGRGKVEVLHRWQVPSVHRLVLASAISVAQIGVMIPCACCCLAYVHVRSRSLHSGCSTSAQKP